MFYIIIYYYYLLLLFILLLLSRSLRDDKVSQDINKTMINS